MLTAIWQWIQFRTWLELASLVAGIAILSPFLFSRTFRKRAARFGSDEIEFIGLAVLIAALIGIGLYNRFSTGNGP